ncbi:MAG: ATP-binding protein [Thainema sp.]
MTESVPPPSRLRLSPSGLQRVDTILERFGWRKQSPAWCMKAEVSESTLKRFRARKLLKATTFQRICRALELPWEEVVEVSLPSETEQDASTWVGRAALLNTLNEQIQSCRLLIVTGITGIGKTALIEQFVRSLRSQYSHTIFFNFEAQPHVQFVDAARVALEQISQPVTEEEQQQPEQLISRWIQLLANQHYLVVIDSLEQILKGDEQTGWSNFVDPLWDLFFHRLLGQESCHSRILLTSQDLPGDLQVHGQRYHTRFWHQRLQGLNAEEQTLLFQRQGFELEPASLEQDYLVRIGAAYEGHPLALRVIAGDIWERFDGEVVAYWQQYGGKIEAVEQSRVTLELDRYSQELRRAVRSRIEESFKRLYQDLPDAYLLMCIASVHREPVTEDFLLNSVRRLGWSDEQCEKALYTLLDRSLLEIAPGYHLRQHNLIRSVAKDHLDNSENIDN